MHNDSRPDRCPQTTQPSQGVADRRSRPDRRTGTERRNSADRRRPVDNDASLAELENRVAAAIRQHGGKLKADGSGWDKLIIPFN